MAALAHDSGNLEKSHENNSKKQSGHKEVKSMRSGGNGQVSQSSGAQSNRNNNAVAGYS